MSQECEAEPQLLVHCCPNVQAQTATVYLLPVTAGEALVPAAGEVEAAPGEGDWLAPAAGEAEVVPEAGDWLAPAAGEAEVVPDAGELDAPPVAGDAEVVPEAGELDVAAADAAGLLLAPDAGDAPVAAGDVPEDPAGLCTPKHRVNTMAQAGEHGQLEGPMEKHVLPNEELCHASTGSIPLDRRPMSAHMSGKPNASLPGCMS